jgi:hypothetical protein
VGVEEGTLREEDMAYCLLGIFGVNMQPLYGEEEKLSFGFKMKS